MTQKRYTEIPKRQKCVNKEEPYIGGAEDIVDDTFGKPQSQVNQERIEDVATLDGKIGAEKTRAEGVEGGLNTRLQTVEQLAEISIGGGDAQIATGADFTNPDATKRAKIPTVGAIVDRLNDGVYDVSKRNPTAGPNSDGKFTLDYILSNADTLIPTGWRHGGMTISFVDSSDNKYVQYRLMNNQWSTTVSNWENTTVNLNYLSVKSSKFLGCFLINGVVTNSGKWAINGDITITNSLVLKVKGGDIIKTTANSDRSAFWSFVKDINPSFKAGDNVNFSSNPSFSYRRETISSGTGELTVPDDVNYIIFNGFNVNNDSTPAEICKNGISLSEPSLDILSLYNSVSESVSTLSNNVSEEVLSLSNRIAKIADSKFYYSDVDGMIKMNNTYTYVNNPIGALIKIVPGSKVQITAKSNLNADFAFLKTFNSSIQEGATPDFSSTAGYTTRIRLTMGTSETYVCPQDSNYLFINKTVNSVSIMPASIIVNGLSIFDDILINLLKCQDTSDVENNSVENEVVEEYINNTLYDNADYTYSEITNYSNKTTDYRKDQPKSLDIDLSVYTNPSKLKIGDNEGFSYLYTGLSGQTFELNNLIPNKEYFVKPMNSNDVVLDSKNIILNGQLRMIKCDSLINVRDIGGWEAYNGKHIKYGLLIRGCALNEGSYVVSETDKELLVNFIGIRSEFDLSTNQGSSPLGNSVEYNSIDPPRWQEYNETPGNARRDALNLIRLMITTLQNGKPIYIHCLGGADRTGSSVMTIGAILGVSENDLIKDWELTSFSTYGLRARNLGYPPTPSLYDYPAYALPSIKEYTGNDLSEKWINYLKDSTGLPSGVQPLSDEEVNTLRGLMLE